MTITIRLLALGLLPLLLSPPAERESPYVFGSLSETIAPRAVAAMVGAAGPFWAVYGVSHPISDQGVATVFLAPSAATSNLRRGTARTVRCPSVVDLGRCTQWEVSGPLVVYVQGRGWSALRCQPSTTDS